MKWYWQTFKKVSTLLNEKQICLTQICNNMYICNFLGVKHLTPYELFYYCLRDTNHQSVEITSYSTFRIWIKLFTNNVMHESILMVSWELPINMLNSYFVQYILFLRKIKRNILVTFNKKCHFFTMNGF